MWMAPYHSSRLIQKSCQKSESFYHQQCHKNKLLFYSPNKTQIFHRQFQLLFDCKISVLILFQKISLHVTRYTWHAMNLKRNQDKNVDRWD